MENARLQKALADAKQTEDRLREERNKQKKYIGRLLWDIQQLQEELTSIRENYVALRKKKPIVQTSEAGTQTFSTPALSTPALSTPAAHLTPVFFHHHERSKDHHHHGRKRERDTDF
jgi:septal ring factor EnvC (AmiA/AmiB activator)